MSRLTTHLCLSLRKLRRETHRVACCRPIPCALLLAALGGAPDAARAQSLIPGVDEWAKATTEGAAPKWVGARVPFPEPMPRPLADGRLDSLLFPLSVHAGPQVPAARVHGVLAAAERAHAVLAAAGWVPQFGDAGQGGTPGHDLYVLADARQGAHAALDATEPAWDLDGARAFAVLDARVPESHLLACTTEALAQAWLYEQDPAEAESLRKSSAAYLAWLVTGQLGCDGDPVQDEPERAALGPEANPRGTAWLTELGRRQDHNTGTFLRDMWQFARQRTWEGGGLRASPDLFEAIAKALEHGNQLFPEVAAEIADAIALPGLSAEAQEHPRWTELTWSKLPARPPPSPPVEPLGTYYAVVRIDRPLSDAHRIRVWSRGEYGTRWALSVTRVGRDGQPRGRISAPARRNPNSFVSLELDAETQAVLISVTNVPDPLPDADLGATFPVRSVALIVDQGRDGELSAAEP